MNEPEPETQKLSANKQIDAADLLEWYFCEGKTSFARSVMGPMLSKAELYRHGSFPCYKCEDSPGIDDKTGDWCKRCNGTGFKHYELYSTSEEITARPTAEVVETRGFEPSHDVLQKYGAISRQLDAVRVKFGHAGVRVLEAFHGDAGARWGRTKHGRLFAVYPHTSAGRRVLAKATSANDPIELTSCEKLAVQAELQTAQPKLWRRELMDKAATQAEELYLDVLATFCGFDKTKKKAPKKRRATRRERENEAWAGSAPGAKEHGFKFEELKEAAGF